MANHIQASFAAGELDPALHERTTLQKYDAGLKTARNVMIGKTGRIMTRMGRNHLFAAKLANRKVIAYSPPNTGYLLEWGHLYVRVWSLDQSLTTFAVGAAVVGIYSGTNEYAHALTEADLSSIHFESTKTFVYIFCQGKAPLKFDPLTGFISNGFAPVDLFGAPIAAPTPATVPITAMTGTGGPVDYAITKVQNGQESNPVFYIYGSSGLYTQKLPINTGEGITIDVNTGSYINGTNEVRIYRRPSNGGAYGYVGSSAAVTADGSLNGIYRFIDLGQTADYSHQPPTINYNPVANSSTYPKTGVVYQQRLLLGNYTGLGTLDSRSEVIEASRSGYQGNFYRDYPLSADSALTFKSGTSGQAKVLRMISSDGLIVFTSIGIFKHTGVLTPTNLTLDEKGHYIIDEKLPPLKIPGGLLFFDKKTNTVRSLKIAITGQVYSAEDLSVFSDHLFNGRSIVSWCFHDGLTPCLLAVFSDGAFAQFTYEESQEMRAWTRSDSALPVEYVCGTGLSDKSVFIVNKNGTRYFEITNPRYVNTSLIATNPEAIMNQSYAFMDSMVSYTNCLNDQLASTDTITVIPQTTNPDTTPNWNGLLGLSCTYPLFPVAGAGAVNNILRFFNPIDGTTVNLRVITHTTDNWIFVQPDATFPAESASTPRLYNTTATITGLGHLEGEAVAVVVDGYVAGAPFNDIDGDQTIIVTGGAITLPAIVGNSTGRGAIVHVGRPIVADVETLDIDTVEQRPVLIESQTVNKIYVKVYRSRGVYCGNKFVDGDLVKGIDPSKEMVDVEQLDLNQNFVPDNQEDNAGDLLGNRYIPAQTKRYEISIPGDWQSHGRVCFRQVDPLHFEFLSIIADTEDLRRRG